VSGDAAGATLVRSTLPVVYAVVVLALRKVREGRGTRICDGFCSLTAGPPANVLRSGELRTVRTMRSGNSNTFLTAAFESCQTAEPNPSSTVGTQ
jgi:hypothetical protein